MKHKIVETEAGKVLIDESAEIKDYYYQAKSNLIFLETDPKRVESINLRNKKGRSALIATINFSISLDVPMIIIEDEVEKVVNEWYEVGKFKSDFPHDKASFKEGYTAAQQKGYSEEDLIDFALWIKIECFYVAKGWRCHLDNLLPNGEIPYHTINDLLLKFQSLRQESIELEMEIDTTKIDNCSMFANEIGCTLSKCECENEFIPKLKTARVDGGQLMAYVKKQQ